jgi:hypothetical protein
MSLSKEALNLSGDDRSHPLAEDVRPETSSARLAAACAMKSRKHYTTISV